MGFPAFAGEPPTGENWMTATNKNCAGRLKGLGPSYSITWSGACENGMLKGRGVVLLYNNGEEVARFEGEYQDGQIPDRGKRSHPNGARYEGGLRDGMPHGSGVFNYAGGNRYSGGFKMGAYEGKGIEYDASGFRFEGEFKNGRKHGRGTYIFPDGVRYTANYTPTYSFDQSSDGPAEYISARGLKLKFTIKNGVRKKPSNKARDCIKIGTVPNSKLAFENTCSTPIFLMWCKQSSSCTKEHHTFNKVLDLKPGERKVKKISKGIVSRACHGSIAGGLDRVLNDVLKGQLCFFEPNVDSFIDKKIKMLRKKHKANQ